MNIIRGTTPVIVVNVKNDIDLTEVANVWVYIAQRGRPVVDKIMRDAEIDAENKKITVNVSQKESLKLNAGVALLQVRLLMEDGTAMATYAQDVEVAEIYKGGVIA